MIATRLARSAAAVGVVVLIAAGSACSPTDEDTRSATAGLPDLEQRLAAEQWALDADESTVDGPLPPGATLVFADGFVSGVADCNTFRAPVELDEADGEVRIGDVATTLQACPEAEGSDPEGTFLAALTGAHEADTTDPDHLVLTRDGADLVFDAVDAEDRLAGGWSVVQVNDGDAITAVLGTADPVLQFDDDGRLTVQTACRPTEGRWSAQGTVVDVQDLDPATDCEHAGDDAAAGDADLVAALQDARNLELTGDSLVLLAEDGRILLVAQRRP